MNKTKENIENLKSTKFRCLILKHFANNKVLKFSEFLKIREEAYNVEDKL